MQKKLVKIAFIVIAFTMLLACAKEEKRELIFRITWTDYSGRGVAIQQIVDHYNENSATHVVRLIGGDEDLTAIELALDEYKSNGVFVLPYRYVRYLGEQEKLLNLNDAFVQERDQFDPALFFLGVVQDNLYGLPWVNHFIALIYNADLLASADVDPNQINNLFDLVAALQKVEDETDAKGIGLVGADHHDLSWMVNQFIYGFGSQLVDETGKVVLINNEQSRDAIQFYRDILGSHAQDSWLDDNGLDVMDVFRNQEVAFEFQGIWGITDIEKNGSPFKTGVINLEQIGLNPEVGPLMMAVSVEMDDNDVEAAYDFMRFMISEYAQTEIMKGEYSPEHDRYYPFRVPANKLVVNQLITSDQKQYVPFAIGFSKPSIDLPTARWQLIRDDIYIPGLHRVMTGELSVEDFLNQVELEGNRILNP